jgi:hypothetical protein
MRESLLITLSVFLAKYSRMANSVFVSFIGSPDISALKFLLLMVISQRVSTLCNFDFLRLSIRFIVVATRAMSSRGEKGFDT